MAEKNVPMKDLVELITESLVDETANVEVSEIEGNQTNIIELKVAKEDMGSIRPQTEWNTRKPGPPSDNKPPSGLSFASISSPYFLISLGSWSEQKRTPSLSDAYKPPLSWCRSNLSFDDKQSTGPLGRGVDDREAVVYVAHEEF